MGNCTLCTEMIHQRKEVKVEGIEKSPRNLIEICKTQPYYSTLIFLQFRIKRFLNHHKKQRCYVNNNNSNRDTKNQNNSGRQSKTPSRFPDINNTQPHHNRTEENGANINNNTSTNYDKNNNGVAPNSYDVLTQQVRKNDIDKKLISQDPFQRKATSHRSQGADDPRSEVCDNKRRKYPKIQEEDYIYEGEWKNGKRDGLGILSMKDIKYIGEFLDNAVHGFGVIYHSDEEKFVGKWIELKANGPGYFISQNTSYSQGYWENDLLQGFGIENWVKGQYTGDYSQGNKEGIGELIFEDNGSYKGEFLASSLSGVGTFIFKDGRKYEGEWRNNKMNGYGMITVGEKKSFYEGEFIDDRREGFGVFYSQRKIYLGMWRNSKLEGNTIIIENGTLKKQFWENGKTIKNLPQNNKIFFEKYVHEIIDSQYLKIKRQEG